MKLDILLFTENCGSSWICDLLGQSKNIAYLDFEPLYNLLMNKKSSLAVSLYIGRLFDFSIEKFIKTRKLLGMADYTPEQFDKLEKADIFLFKARCNEVPESKIPNLIEHGVRIIYLKRDSLLKQTISVYKRRVLGISHFEFFSITPAILIEKNKFIEVLKTIQEKNAEADKFYDEWTGFKIIIKYEDFMNNLSSRLRMVENKLGYSRISDQGFFSKITSDDLSEAVINFEEVIVWFNSFLESNQTYEKNN